MLWNGFRIARNFSTTSRLVMASKEKKVSSQYSSTVLLPKTSFPARLEGEKRIAKDREILESENFRKLYEMQRKMEDKDQKEFVLHDGPPYANGSLHMGHAVNKILKDITNRWKLIKGYRVHFRPGWDCHGLPIENKVLTEGCKNNPLLNSSSKCPENEETNKIKTALELRSKARKLALEAVEIQKQQFLSWGIMGDWSNPYLTLSPEFMKEQMKIFLKLFEDKKVFQEYMPVYWSPVSRTALAEAELEYNSNHESTSVYVRFPLTKETCKKFDLQSVFALIWTTTPWSLVANKAICFKEGANYVILGKEHNDSENYLIAESRVNYLREIFEDSLGSILIRKVLKGSELRDCFYEHPMSGELWKSSTNSLIGPMLPSDHVTLDAGTGLVHTAPAHGQDDFRIGLKHRLDLSCSVNELGCYTDDLSESLANLYVLKEGSEKVIEILSKKGDILKKEKYVHSYPYDWRSKTPVILRGSKQWFLDVDSVQALALNSVEKEVKIMPESAQFGFKGVLEKRPYWCISRQRAWGSQIPVLYDAEMKPLITKELIEHYSKLIDKHGTDFWWILSDSELLEGTGIDPDSITRGYDILDIWFDSGISWHILEQKFPADLYLEGLDQFNGWFYTSLITSLAVNGKSPFKNLFVNGFAVDESGRKMSKSLGNVISPEMITEGRNESSAKNSKKSKNSKKVYGVDLLRYWVCSHASQTQSIIVSNSILDQTKVDLDKLRLVFKFIFGNLSATHSNEIASRFEKPVIEFDCLKPLDRYILCMVEKFKSKVESSYDNMKYNQVCLGLNHFLTNDLSAFYFHRIKDRLYCEGLNSFDRNSALTALYHILEALMIIVAPMTPILISEILETNPNLNNCYTNPENNFGTSNGFADEKLEAEVELLSKIQVEISKLISNEQLKNHELILNHVALGPSWTPADLSEFFQMPKVILDESLSSEYSKTVQMEFCSFSVRKSECHKCPRCRILVSSNENELCSRCQNVIGLS